MSVIPHTVGTTETKIASIQRSRTSLVVMNTHGANTLYCKFSKGVSATNGIPVYSTGNISLKIPEDDPTLELWAIASGANTTIVVYEGYGRIAQ